MKRIGILGGTFNPPHIAHAILADEVKQQLNLDKIVFVPAGKPPLKDESGVIDSSHRFNMAKLAFEDNLAFEVSDIEIKRDKEKSYTIDTLIKFHELYNKEYFKLFLIVGIDNLIDFPRWKNPDEIFEKSIVIVVNRPGFSSDVIEPRFYEKAKFINIPGMDISSSLIRDYVRLGKSIKNLVNPRVEKYILENNLYKN